MAAKTQGVDVNGARYPMGCSGRCGNNVMGKREKSSQLGIILAIELDVEHQHPHNDTSLDADGQLNRALPLKLASRLGEEISVFGQHMSSQALNLLTPSY